MQSFEVERFLLDVDKAFIKIIWIKCATLQPSYHSNTARGEAHSPLPSHDLPFLLLELKMLARRIIYISVIKYMMKRYACTLSPDPFGWLHWATRFYQSEYPVASIWQWWLLFLLLIIYLFLIVLNCFLVFYLCEQQMWKNKAAGGTFLLTSSLNPPWKWSVFQKLLWGLRTECLLSWERSPVIQGRLHLSSMPSALRIVCCLSTLSVICLPHA